MSTVRLCLLPLLVVACGLLERNKPARDGNEAASGAPADAVGVAGAPEPGMGMSAGQGGVGSVAGSGAVPIVMAGAPAEPEPDDPLVASQAAICDGYLAVWKVRNAELASNTDSCFACLGYDAACFAAREAITAGQLACFDRHCLCDPTKEDCDAFEYPADTCACFGSCLPDAPHPSRQKWLDHMACEVASCAAACQ